MKNLKAFESFHAKEVNEKATALGALESLSFSVNVLYWMIDEGYLGSNGEMKGEGEFDLPELNKDIKEEFGADGMFKSVDEVETFFSTVCTEMAEFAKKFGN